MRMLICRKRSKDKNESNHRSEVPIFILPEALESKLGKSAPYPCDTVLWH
jgi:hypothetical protein